MLGVGFYGWLAIRGCEAAVYVFSDCIALFLNHFLFSELVRLNHPCELHPTLYSLVRLGPALIDDGDTRLVRASLYIKELIASSSSPWSWRICLNRWFSQLTRSAATWTSFVACTPRSRVSASLCSRSATYSLCRWRCLRLLSLRRRARFWS